MTDILDQIDTVIAQVQACACGCGRSISEKGPSADFYNDVCQARWQARQVGAVPDVIVVPPRCPACARWMDVAGRYCEPCAIALSAPITGDYGPVARPSFTLADMEAASAAVRARRHQIADLFDVPHELVEPASVRLCVCPVDPDDEVDPGDPVSTCPVHGWREAAVGRPWWRRMLGAQR